jgi:Protein of unknown function (DUF3040)
MSWPSRQQRVLEQIEKTLLADDYRLAALFAYFAGLTRDDARPGTERIRAWSRRPRSVLLAAAGLVVLTTFMLAWLGPGSQVCPTAAVTTSASSSSAARSAASRPTNQGSQPHKLTGNGITLYQAEFMNSCSSKP